MNRINWDLMRPQDIEIRPAQIKDGKATLLLYQDSRNTMDALDRNFGEFGWKIEYKDVGGQIYGRLSIYNEGTKEWIYKEDTGEKSNISEDKGMSSDILKRCAVRFGYGRELYSAPRIVVNDDGYGCRGYKVAEIEYDTDRNITRLILTDIRGNKAFEWSKGNPVPEQPLTAQNQPKNGQNLEILRSFCTEQKNNGADQEELLRFFNFYKQKMSGWRGVVKPDVLFARWNAKTVDVSQQYS